MGKKKKARTGLYVVDSSLKPRIQEYVDLRIKEKGADVRIDPDACLSFLLQRYPMYQRKRKNELLSTVSAVLLEFRERGQTPSSEDRGRKHPRKNSSSDSGSDSDTSDEEEEPKGHNTMNAQLMSLYLQSPRPPLPTSTPTPSSDPSSLQFDNLASPDSTPSTPAPAPAPAGPLTPFSFASFAGSLNNNASAASSSNGTPSASLTNTTPGASLAELAMLSGDAASDKVEISHEVSRAREPEDKRRSKERSEKSSRSDRSEKSSRRSKPSQRTQARRSSSRGGGGDLKEGETIYLPETSDRPPVNYADVGGVDVILQDIRELIEWPLTHPEIYAHLGVEPPRGILLHGPPGCGKTLLAHAIAGELGVNFLKISAPEIVSGMSGESEAKIRQLFAAAVEQAPCLLFVDEIDAITPKRENAQREMERRIVAQLLTCMDMLSVDYNSEMSHAPVIVIGATNRPDSLDPALRRAGRFDREIAMSMPDENSRAQILRTMTRKMKLQGDFDFRLIAKKTSGFVGADLVALTKEAAVLAVNRIFQQILTNPDAFPSSLSFSKEAIAESITEVPAESAAEPVTDQSADLKMEVDEKSADISSPTQEIVAAPTLASSVVEERKKKEQDLTNRQIISNQLRQKTKPLTAAELEPLCISMEDFLAAIGKVQPSSKREGFASVPETTWADIGALDDLREELDMAIAQPIENPHAFEQIGITVPAGVLLFGPPGCGKTLVAKAVANACGASFISVKGPELLNKYVGESERGVRQVFQRARASRPCIIFFDEMDALCPRRGSGGGRDGDSVSERVVNQLLTEMDGLEDRKQIFVVAATNRPDIIDPAMLRPGRLDKLLYVPLPDAAGRGSILQALCRKVPIAADVRLQLDRIAADHRCDYFSGADLSALVREASLQALRLAQRTLAQKRQQLVSEGRESELASLSMPPIVVLAEHFEFAFTKVLPSVSEASRRRYDQMHAQLRKARSNIENKKSTESENEASNASSSSSS